MQEVVIPKIVPPSEILGFMDLSVLQKIPILGTIFVVFSFFYIAVSIILFYHWIKYGMGSRKVFLAEILFVIVSIVLFIFSISSLINYQYEL